MKARIKILVTGAVLASSMILSTDAAMARDNKHYDRQALAQAQNQLNHDLQRRK